MDAIILAGGLGTRIQRVSKGLPKSLLPVDNAVFLDRVIDNVIRYEINDIYLSLHYKPDLFDKYVSRSDYASMISQVVEPEPMGTGGAIKYVIQHNDISDPFFVLNGDTLSDTNLNNMKRRYDETNYHGMIGVSCVDDASRYGTVEFSGDGVVGFKEKGEHSSGWISNGHYILNKIVFVDHHSKFSIEYNVFPDLAYKNLLGVFPVEHDSFIDIGVPEDYNRLLRTFVTHI